ncbi:unnamed protein product, partial [Rotaria sp. Silwood2]
MSFIRYRCKSEKDFKLFPCDEMSCSLGNLKRFLMGKSSKLASRRSKDEIDFIVTNASTNEDDDAKLSPIRSAHPGARPSHIVSRSSPYQLSYGHVRRRSIHKTAAGISCDNLIAIPREIPGALQDKSGAVLLFQDKWR